MLAVVVGLIFVVLGVWGIVHWWPDFIGVLKGSVPAMFVCGGLLAIIAGITAIRDKISTPKTENK